MLLNTTKGVVNVEALRLQEIGSYAWGYNRASSDHDMLVVYKDDPLRTIFGEPKLQLINDPNCGSSYVACRLSDFIVQCTKFNLNYYCYLWSNKYVLKTSKEIECIKAWQSKYLSKFKEPWYKLCVQAVSCVQSYYRNNQTYKDLYRIAYMTDLAIQFMNSAESKAIVSPYWAPQTIVTKQVHDLWLLQLDGSLSNEHGLLFEQVYNESLAIHCPVFSLPKATVDDCVDLFRSGE